MPRIGPPRERLLLALAVVIALAFRVYDLSVLPHWYWDEGVNLDLACNLLAGDARSFAMYYSFLPHPPLYPLISAGWLSLFGGVCTLTVLRTLSVVLSLATLLLLFTLGRHISGSWMGITAAVLLAVYPGAVYWQRLAFANHLLSFLTLASLVCFVVFHDTLRVRWLYAAGLLAGLAAVTQVNGIAVVASYLYLIWRLRPRGGVGAAVVSVFPGIVFTVVMLAWRPAAFLHDLAYLLSRGPPVPPSQTLAAVFFLAVLYVFRRQAGIVLRENARQLFNAIPRYRPPTTRAGRLRHDAFILASLLYVAASLTTFFGPTDESLLYGVDFYWLGLAGLVFLPRLRHFVGAYTLPLFFAFLRIGRTDHMVIPLYPFFALGLAILAFVLYRRWLAEIAKHLTPSPRLVKLLVFLVVSAFFWTSLAHDLSLFFVGGALEKTDPTQYRQIAAALEARRHPGNVVIAQSHFTQFIEDDLCVLTQAVAHDGRNISYYPATLDESRWAFDCSLARSRFLVATNETLEWLVNESHADLAADIKQWPVVAETPAFSAYENPRSKQ